MAKVIIERDKWYRGKTGDKSCLQIANRFDRELSVDDIGKRCCLGFKMLADGFSEEDISEKAYPYMVSEINSNGTWLIDQFYDPTRISNLAAAINDFKITETSTLLTVNKEDWELATKYALLVDSCGKAFKNYQTSDCSGYIKIESENRREELLRKIFEDNGDELEFV